MHTEALSTCLSARGGGRCWARTPRAGCPSSPRGPVLQVSLGSLFGRHTLASSAWWSTPTSNCPSTRRRSWTCTRARRGTRCHPTSTPSPTRPTGACCKVSRPQRDRVRPGAAPCRGLPPGMPALPRPLLPACRPAVLAKNVEFGRRSWAPGAL